MYTIDIPTLKNHLHTINSQSERVRVRAIIKIGQQKQIQDIAEELMVSRRSISTWNKRFTEKGISGLQDNSGGRKEGNPKWNQEIFKSLAVEIEKQDRYWSIPLMVEWIKVHHKKTIPEQTIWYQLDKRGYSYKSSRPHPYLGNKEKQESFKKGAWYKASGQ
jgi:transposase